MTAYYYAGGRRVTLETDDEHVAIDSQAASAAGIEKSAKNPLRKLPGGVVVAVRSDLDEKQLASLRTAGALRPVYRHDRALLVPLPEIRVEFDNAKQRKSVQAAIAKAPHAVEITEESDDRIVLRPRSGLSDEALAVANYLYEQAHPAASSVRFVQIVPRY